MHREQRCQLVHCSQCIESRRNCHYGCIDVLETVGSDDENSHFKPEELCLFVYDGKVDAFIFWTLVLRVKRKDASLWSEGRVFLQAGSTAWSKPKTTASKRVLMEEMFLWVKAEGWKHGLLCCGSGLVYLEGNFASSVCMRSPKCITWLGPVNV